MTWLWIKGDPNQYWTVCVLSASDSMSQLQRVHGFVWAAHPDGAGVPQSPVRDRPACSEEVSLVGLRFKDESKASLLLNLLIMNCEGCILLSELFGMCGNHGNHWCRDSSWSVLRWTVWTEVWNGNCPHCYVKVQLQFVQIRFLSSLQWWVNTCCFACWYSSSVSDLSLCDFLFALLGLSSIHQCEQDTIQN